MAPKKKVTGMIKLQIQAGAANPAPPIGPALGQHGVNIMEFCTAYNNATADQRGNVVPVEISVYEDRSFTFVLKTPPAAELLKKAAGAARDASSVASQPPTTPGAPTLTPLAEPRDGGAFAGRPPALLTTLAGRAARGTAAATAAAASSS